ncbi:MAG: hypothetical protein N2561_02945 [Bacteroidetes bacterium]|nr:hypothetical protein [Bacteroidota bacterium]
MDIAANLECVDELLREYEHFDPLVLSELFSPLDIASAAVKGPNPF